MTAIKHERIIGGRVPRPGVQWGRERKNGIDPDYFYDYYAAAGWQVGQHPVRDWKALVRTWEKRDMQRGPLADTMRSVLDMAQAKRSRQRKDTFDNYQDKRSYVDLDAIALTLDDEL